jgi:hypothetical protein
MGRRSSTSSRCFGVREHRLPRVTTGHAVARGGSGAHRRRAAPACVEGAAAYSAGAEIRRRARRVIPASPRAPEAQRRPATGARGCGVQRNRGGSGRAPGGFRRELKRAGCRGVDGRVSVVPVDAITSARILMEHRSHGPVPRGTLGRLGLRPDPVSRLEGHAVSFPVVFPSLPLCGNVGAIDLASRHPRYAEGRVACHARRLPARARRARRAAVLLLQHATPNS